MSAIQGFFAVLALIGAGILYVAGWAIAEPPVWASLFAREPVTVIESTVENRQAKWPALPVIDVRDVAGVESSVLGYRWMSEADAQAVVEANPVDAVIELPRWNDRFWNRLSGIGDWVLVIVSLVAAFITLFGLWVIWKLRKA